MCVCVCVCSGELQKPVAGQPSVNELVECVLRESRKESMVYKLAALRATGEILEATQTDRFTELSLIVFPIIKKVPNPPPTTHSTCTHTHATLP